MLSSKGLPSLATVVERFRWPPKKRDCLKEDLFSGLESLVPSLLRLVLLPRLLILKKFLIRCGKCDDPLVCLCEPAEKFRFSDDMRDVFEEVPKSCVILQGESSIFWTGGCWYGR